MEKYTSLFWC